MRDQATANLQWFRQNLPNLLQSYRGQHALLHEQGIVTCFPSSLDAIKAGITRFGEGNFSVELVDDSVEDLGFYSHVASALHA